MEGGIKYCDVKCNWSEQGELEKLSVYHIENQGDEATEQENSPVAQIERGFYLVAPGHSTEAEESVDDDLRDAPMGAESGNAGELRLHHQEAAQGTREPCELSVQCRNPPYGVAVSAIDIICGARTMEVYSPSGDYVDTSQGIRVDEEIGEAKMLYMVQLSLEIPVQGLRVKLLSLVEQHQLWVHSIHLTLTLQESMPQWAGASTIALGSKVDLNKVKAMMSKTGQPLSAGAQRLLTSVEQSQKNKQASMGAFAEMFLGGDIGRASPSSHQMAALMSTLSTLRMNTEQSSSQTNQRATLNVDGVLTVPGAEKHVCDSNPVGEVFSADMVQCQPSSRPTPAGDSAGHSTDSDGTFSGQESSSDIVHRPDCNYAAGNCTLESTDSFNIPAADGPSHKSHSIPATNNTAHTRDHSKVSSPQVQLSQPLEAGLVAYVAAMEQRILTMVSAKIEASEQRLNAKLDKILDLLRRQDCSSSLPDMLSLDPE